MLITPDQERFHPDTGPVDATPSAAGLSRPVLYDYDRRFSPSTSARWRSFAGAAHSACAGDPAGRARARARGGAASLIAREDVVLNLVSGVYGAGFGFWAKRYCAELLEIRVPYNEVIDPRSVAALLEARPEIAWCPSAITTPVRDHQPVAEIGRIVAAHGAYLLVDAVSSFGGMEVGPDSCQADLFVTGPNKCLGCRRAVAGRVTPRAWEKMKAIRMRRAIPC